MPAGSFEKVGVQAVVEGFGRYMQDLGKMEAKSKGFGGSLRSLGKTALAMGTGFIAAQASMAGVQAVMSKSIGAAMAYEAQMAQIRALTGATEADTDLLTVAIKDMATAMPKSPAELGAAAYFILSSGIEDASDAAEVLEVAAKASTIGLGETEGVANALTTVLNAYGKSAGEAGQVTDVMIEAVKQGKAEASEFAGVLGRVVPLAAQMGISFEEVAANLATFTRLGVSADEAATGLRQVMASLLKPTVDQEEAMAALGFTAEGLRQQIKDKGLLATLDEMITATGGNEAAIAKLFPNIRALTSVLGTAGVQMDAYTDILGATNNATGNLDEGFAIVADTAKFKVGVAMNELNLVLMDMGEKTLPVVVQAARLLASMIEDLDQLISVLEGDVDDTNAVLDKSSDQWIDWAGVQQSAMATGIVAGQEFAGAVKSIFSSGGYVPSALIDTQDEVNRLNARAGEMAATQAALGASAQVAAAGERDLAAAVGSLAAAVMGANAALQAMAGGFGAITEQRTAETLALDIEINALKQEQNAAQQAAVGQESYGGAVERATSAIDEQIAALENQAAALIPEVIEAEVIALEHEATVLGLLAAEIEGQILARQDLLDAYEAELEAHEAAVEAVEAEIDALDKQIDSLGDVIGGIDKQIKIKQDLVDAREEDIAAVQSEIDELNRLIDGMARTVEGLDKQIAAERKLAKERAGTLPHSIKLNKLELEKERLLQKVEGETEDLTDAEKERLEEIKRQMDAERRAIRIKELEAKATELQAQKSGEHLRALIAERAAILAEMESLKRQISTKEAYIETLMPTELLEEIEALKKQKEATEAQIEKIEALKEGREAYIETLAPPEMPQEIEDLREHKAEVEADIAKVRNLKTQRELYIKTLIPPELQQEINKLKEEKTALDNAAGAAGGLTSATGGLTTALDNQITKLNLEREAIDLVTEAWRLQGEKIKELPTIPDILGQLKGYKALLMLDLQKEMMDAFKAGNFPKVAELAGWIARLGAITFAQHGFHGDVSRPTMFVAGEAGRERVDISPTAQRDTVLAPQAVTMLGFDRLADLISGRSGGMSVSVSAASQEQIAEEVGRTLRGLAFEMGRVSV